MARKTLLTVDGFHNKVKKQLMTIDGVYRNVAKAYLTNDQGIWQQVWPCYTWRRYRVDTVPLFVWDQWSKTVVTKYTGNVSVTNSGGSQTATWSPTFPTNDPPKIDEENMTWRTRSGTWDGVNSGGSWIVRSKSLSNNCYFVTDVEQVTTSSVKFYYSKIARAIATTVDTQGSTHYGQVTSVDSEAYPDNGAQDGYWYVYNTTTTETVKGELVDIVTGDSPNAYPADGIHTDGYWYVLEVEPDGPQLYTADGLPVYTADGLPVYLRR